MVSHKCVEEFGSKGYLLPSNARASRSARKKRGEDDEMGGIDLLATVAGNLLLERMSIDKPVEDNFLLVKEDKPLKLDDDPYQRSLSPYGFSSVINGKVENESESFSEVGGFSQVVKPGIDGHAVVLDARTDVVVSLGSCSRTELPTIGNVASHGVRDDVNMLSRDDDENFSGYICPRFNKKPPRTVPRIGDRRIRKILASRHWKGGSRHADVKPWGNYYFQHQRNYPTKNHISDDNRRRTKMYRGSRTISSRKGQGASFVSSNSQVKLRIKSFRVPELFVEIPETATVGSLKRMVMEAVSSLLSDGHRVGLMVQGKKVRDDNKTLYQTGISEENTHLDSLDFSLEPSSDAPQLLTSHPLGLSCEELLPVSHASMESEYALFPSDSFGKKSAEDESNPELSHQTPCRKTKRSEQQQATEARRRIRRPFSVSEVEALVEAVEKLGTGRWREIKIYAFEDVDHRTYVDLKDKWKTLVHTAKITPQQRRGEPVPQELLNRVLNAHGYWTQKHQEESLMMIKQEQETLVKAEDLLQF